MYLALTRICILLLGTSWVLIATSVAQGEPKIDLVGHVHCLSGKGYMPAENVTILLHGDPEISTLTTKTGYYRLQLPFSKVYGKKIVILYFSGDRLLDSAPEYVTKGSRLGKRHDRVIYDMRLIQLNEDCRKLHKTIPESPPPKDGQSGFRWIGLGAVVSTLSYYIVLAELPELCEFCELERRDVVIASPIFTPLHKQIRTYLAPYFGFRHASNRDFPAKQFVNFSADADKMQVTAGGAMGSSMRLFEAHISVPGPSRWKTRISYYNQLSNGPSFAVLLDDGARGETRTEVSEHIASVGGITEIRKDLSVALTWRVHSQIVDVPWYVYLNKGELLTGRGVKTENVQDTAMFISTNIVLPRNWYAGASIDVATERLFGRRDDFAGYAFGIGIGYDAKRIQLGIDAEYDNDLSWNASAGIRIRWAQNVDSFLGYLTLDHAVKATMRAGSFWFSYGHTQVDDSVSVGVNFAL